MIKNNNITDLPSLEEINIGSISFYSLPLLTSWQSMEENYGGETINTFKYLEENNVLHRDIRPENLLIDENQKLKLIDFGFGKISKNNNNEESKNKNSVLLNWPVTEMPEEIKRDSEYNNKTEIYFVGKLYEHIIKDKNIDFKYQSIIDKMIEYSYNKRYNSFEDIYKDISKGIFNEIDFSNNDKGTYRNFADSLYNHIRVYKGTYQLKSNIEQIINDLGNVIKENNNFYFSKIEDGYICIDKITEEDYFLKIVYNYAKIESYVKKDNLIDIINYSTIILNSIEYNDTLISNVIEKGTFSGNDIVYEIDKPDDSESKFYQYLQEYVQKNDEEEQEVLLPEE